MPDFERGKPPGFVPEPGATGPAALAGTDPVIMLNDGRRHLFVPAGLADGPLPAHYEAAESPVSNVVYPQDSSPVGKLYPDHKITQEQFGGHGTTYRAWSPPTGSPSITPLAG